MPGLIRGVARTAVIAGTATAVSNRVSRRQASRWAEQGQTQPGYMQPVQQVQQVAPAPAAPAQPDKFAQLKQLADLKDQGVLTQAEFDAEKAKILAT
jgi:membrane protease subunit (stomatin/prohibitin family)